MLVCSTSKDVDTTDAVARPVSCASTDHGAFFIASKALEGAYDDSLASLNSLLIGPGSHLARLLLGTGAHVHDKAFLISCFNDPHAIGMRRIDFEEDCCSALRDARFKCAPIMMQVSYNLGAAWALVQKSALPQTFQLMGAHKEVCSYGQFDGREFVRVDFDKVIEQKLCCKDRFLPYDDARCYIPLEVQQQFAVVVHANGQVNFAVFNSFFEFPSCYSQSAISLPVQPIRSIERELRTKKRKQLEFTSQSVTPCNETLDVSDLVSSCDGLQTLSPIVDFSTTTVRRFVVNDRNKIVS